MTDDPLDPLGLQSLQHTGFQRPALQAIQSALRVAVERIIVQERLTPDEAVARLAEVLGQMGTEEFDRILRLPGDIGTEEPDDLTARGGGGPGGPDEVAAEEERADVAMAEPEFEADAFGDIGTDEPDDE